MYFRGLVGPGKISDNTVMSGANNPGNHRVFDAGSLTLGARKFNRFSPVACPFVPESERDGGWTVEYNGHRISLSTLRPN